MKFKPHYNLRFKRSSCRRLVLFLCLACASLFVQSLADERDEYGWEKSDVTILGGYHSGQSRSEQFKSQASNPDHADRTYSVSYSYSIGGVDLEQVKRNSGRQQKNTTIFRGKVRKGTTVRFRLAMTSASGSLHPKYYGYRATFTPYSVSGYFTESLTELSGQIVKDFSLGQMPIVDTDYKLESSGLYCFRMSAGGMWDGNKAKGVRLEDYPGVQNLTVVVYLLVDENAAAMPVNTGEEEEEATENGTFTDESGAHYEEDNDAWDFGGPWPFAIPASVIAAIGGYAATRRRRKGDDDDDESQDNAPCELHIYKAFGNTLLVGDAPQQVFAKVVRKDPKLGERTDPALTALISITSGDGYLEVQDAGMYGDWRTATVMAPEQREVPEEGIVTFRMGNEMGSYTNRLHFRIENGEVLFGQDNLTIPAFYKKQVELPFVVVGIDPQTDPVEAEVTYQGKTSKDYSVRVEWREKEQMHYALINDLVQDEKANPGVPGKHIDYKLKITSRRSNGREIKGELPLLRFYMGLQIKVKDVKCFIEEYEPLNHKQSRIGVHSQGRFYVPAETRLCLMLYEYDDEKNKLLKLYPIPFYDEKTKKVGFQVTAKDAEKQHMVDKLGMQIQPTTAIDTKDGRICWLRCCSHMLAAPNRLGATIKIKVKHEDREYETEVGVRLCSQPVRQFADNQKWAAAIKEDERITQRLEHIASEIYRHKMVENLFPLLKFIDLLLKSYEEDEERLFGYDKKSIQTVVRTYNDVYSGKKAGANEDPGPPITFADDMRMFIMAWFNAARTVQQNMGLISGIFIGVFAPWVSVAFTVVEVLGDMRDYVEAGGDSILEGWCVGAKVVLREAIMGEIFKRGFAKANKMGLTKENMNKAFNELTGINVQQFWSKSKLSYLTKEIHLFGNKSINAKIDAETRLKQAELNPKNKGGYDLDEATNFGRARARQNVQDLRAACEMYRANPTPENLKLRDNLIMKCQGDKQTMYLLKQKGSTFDLTRRDFNGHLEDLYARTDAAVEAELSKEMNGKQIRHKNMSSKTRTDLKEGKTITLDRDSTYQYLDDDGVWKTIDNQELVDKIYKEKFYQESTGGFKADTGDAPTKLKEKIESRYGQKMDQTIIQNELSHPESYGHDVEKMLGKEHGKALNDPVQVSKAVEFKGKERFEHGRQMLADAEKITDPLEKVAKQADAIGEMMEGCRQEVKIYDQFTVPRDFARSNVNGGSKIPDKLHKAIEQFRKFESGGCKLEELETALEPLGYTLESVAEEMGRAMLNIG